MTSSIRLMIILISCIRNREREREGGGEVCEIMYEISFLCLEQAVSHRVHFSTNWLSFEEGNEIHSLHTPFSLEFLNHWYKYHSNSA